MFFNCSWFLLLMNHRLYKGRSYCVTRGARTISPEQITPPVRVKVWVGVRNRVGGNFPRGQLS